MTRFFLILTTIFTVGVGQAKTSNTTHPWYTADHVQGMGSPVTTTIIPDVPKDLGTLGPEKRT